jgi:uncharacterized protein
MAVVPGLTELTAPYWAAAREGRLAVQECQSCRQVWHPPLPRCPHCHAESLGWRDSSGDGTVYSYTVVRHATHFAFADKIPYVLAIVELAEGPRLVTALTGIAPDEVRVGLRVHAVFRPVTDAVTLPYFEPDHDRDNSDRPSGRAAQPGRAAEPAG